MNSAISFDVLLSRRVGNSVLTVYIPSTMLIIVSWLSLWVRLHRRPPDNEKRPLSPYKCDEALMYVEKGDISLFG